MAHTAIHVLDTHTAELIAAGEVVERPASVVKELCENAIDADARHISVAIDKGGIARMEIQDDGCGVEAEDIPLAFLRHATSKVRTEADLESIVTLGFRGEALASIASVAQVELLTKTEADEFASLYTIHGGQEQGLEAAARGIGTTITVKNLFYNTPARMKFLKKDTSEGTFVTETVTRLALSHPEIAFGLTRDGKKLFSTPGDGKALSAAYAVFGSAFARGLLAVAQKTGQYEVNGLITPPTASRASRAMQFFFINGRFVKNRTMMAALEQAYRGTTMAGKFPGCVLFLNMPPQWVDVNVHPAKTEVRFARENEVFDAVYAAVKGTLFGEMHTHKQLDLNKGWQQPALADEKHVPPPAASAFTGMHAGEPAGQRIRAYNELADTLSSSNSFAPYELSGRQKASANLEDRSLLVTPEAVSEQTLNNGDPAEIAKKCAFISAQQSFTAEAMTPSPLRLVGEIFKTYILAEDGTKMCIIDKHAAHERIIYEKVAQNRAAPNSQQLLVPIAVTLSAAEKDALLQNESSLKAVGLEAEDFGSNNVLIRGVPDDIEPDDVVNLTVEIANRLSVNSKDAIDEKTEWVLHSVACRAAIKAGDATHPQQLLSLAQEIMAGAIPPFCPHGRPVVIEITQKELEKQFGRLL